VGKIREFSKNIDTCDCEPELVSNNVGILTLLGEKQFLEFYATELQVSLCLKCLGGKTDSKIIEAKIPSRN